MDFVIPEHQKGKYANLDKVIIRYQSKPGMLIRILQEAQEIFGHLSILLQTYISQKLDIPISTINSVVSFYSLFSQEPRGKHVISVCLGTACYVKGAQDVLNAVMEELQIKEDETSMDGLFTLKSARCIGACVLAPVITINDEVFGKVSAEDVPAILRRYKKAHSHGSPAKAHEKPSGGRHDDTFSR